MAEAKAEPHIDQFAGRVSEGEVLEELSEMAPRRGMSPVVWVLIVFAIIFALVTALWFGVQSCYLGGTPASEGTTPAGTVQQQPGAIEP